MVHACWCRGSATSHQVRLIHVHEVGTLQPLVCLPAPARRTRGAWHAHARPCTQLQSDANTPMCTAAPQPLVNGASLELAPNSLGLVFGRSGSGKTTLMHLLAGLLQPTSGSIDLQLSGTRCRSPLLACCNAPSGPAVVLERQP